MEEIFIPASGMAAEDVLVSEWLKQPGDEVAAGEPVAVVETDKATVEVSGTTAGRLSRHLVEVGARVPGGTTVAYVLNDGETEPGAPGAGTSAVVEAPTSTPDAPAQGPEARGAGAQPPSAAGSPTDGRRTDGRHTLSPRQRRAMAEPAPVDAAPATPVGAAAESGAKTGAEPPAVVQPGTVPAHRQGTAALVSESWRTMPHFSVGRDVRADGLLEAVSKSRTAGTAVTITDFLVLALARGLEAVGEVPDVGLAVATDWGVLIPVLRSVAGRSVPEVAAARQAAVGRARNRRLDSADGAPTFATLSNLGPAGVSWFTGVVPVNQVALVTVGEVAMRPAVEGRGLVVAPMFTAIVTADHRRYDGTDSARLLAAFVEQLGLVVEET
jgi:pyruvate dehydrogenase E2 component (dihydrolipoamide acetyltransferase)